MIRETRFAAALAAILASVLTLFTAEARAQVRAEEIRARLDIHRDAAGAGASTSLAVRPTSLLGVPIDTAVVERMLRARMNVVQSQALRDLLTGDLAALGRCEPCADLVTTIASLTSQSMDGDARSQAVLAAVTRVGLAFAVASLPRQVSGEFGFGARCPQHVEGRPAPNDVEVVVQRANAAYRGMRASSWLRTLGFPERQDLAAPSESCTEFSVQVTRTLDTVGRLGSDLRAFQALIENVNAVKSACGSLGAPAPAELVAALSALNSTEARDLSLQRLREIRNAFSRARVEITVGDRGLPSAACVESLQSLVSRVDGLLGRVAADLNQDSTLYQLLANVASLADPATVEMVAQAPNVGDAIRRVGVVTLPVSAIPLADLASFDTVNQQRTTSPRSDAVAEIRRRLDAIEANPEFRVLRDVAQRLATRQPLRRGDVVAMAERAKLHIDRVLGGLAERDGRWRLAQRLLDVVLVAVPSSLIEDENAPGGLRLDTASLVAALTSEFGAQDREGFYVRATIGAGYVFTAGGEVERPFYEEIGFGYRWSALNRRLLLGPHVAASGLLYQIQSIGAYAQPVFVGAGFSVNLYRALDVSANVGALFDVSPSGASPNFAFTIGLQLPLADYIAAIASGSGSNTTTTTRGSGSQ